MDNDQFDLEEFKESYAHYRHLEEERSRHLRFFLVIVGALLGVLGFSVKPALPVTGCGSFLFVCGLVVVLLQILDTVTFTAIRRVGDARAKHAEIISHMRGKLTSDQFVADLWDDFKGRPHVSVQSAVENTLHLFALVLFSAAFGGTICALSWGVVLCWQGAVVLALSFICLAVHIRLWWRLKAPK